MPVKHLPLPPLERLQRMYDYDPETGILYSLYQGRHKPLRAVDGEGYRMVRIGGKKGKGYRGTRVIWKLMTGVDPVGQIDHRNGDVGDDRWDNLREATNQQNMRNRKLQKNNTSGLKGVSPRKTGLKPWGANISLNGRMVNLGGFDSKEEAHEVYKAAALKYFGAFYRS